MKLLAMQEDVQKDAVSGGNCKIVRLVPYAHQVGGHQCVMTYDETTICKPMEEKELVFYQQLPDGLQPFTPEFKGVVDVHFVQDDLGTLQLYAIPWPCRCRSSDCKVADYRSEETITRRSWSFEDISRSASKDDDSPCADLMQERMQERMMMILRKRSSGSTTKFLLLGNVAAKFSHPCVLDLKMGTRQYGDNESQRKIDRHTQVCAKSTSKSLGVRLCGMQIFNHKSNKFDFVDKYVGRQLDDVGFENAIKGFLHNGQELLVDVIHPLLQKLSALHKVIEKADCYRFYSCSLLLIYNSSPSDDSLTRLQSADVRLIDFAKVCQKGDATNNHQGPDRGLLFGLETLIRVLRHFQTS